MRRQVILQREVIIESLHLETQMMEKYDENALGQRRMTRRRTKRMCRRDLEGRDGVRCIVTW